MSPEPLTVPSLPPRAPEAHKGDSGRVLVVGGSVGLSGAVRLAALAASRAGAGLVSVAVPEPLRVEVAVADPALMVRGFAATAAGTLAWPALRELASFAEGCRAIVLGPGLGRHPDTLALARRLVQRLPVSMVVDADALSALAEAPAGDAAPAPRVFTPHPGEAARWLGIPTEAVQADREAAIRRLATRAQGVFVLKGRATLVLDGTRLGVNPTGNPGLAMGGSGDVLAGLLGGLLAQGMDAGSAARAGVWLHGAASDRLRATHGERAQTPLDLVSAVGALIASCERGRG